MKVLLAVLAFTNPHLLDLCIDSWPKDVDRAVLWQGEHDEMFPVIEKYKPTININLRRKYNWGVAGGWNIIIREAFTQDYDAIVFVGSDTKMLPGFWESFIKHTENYDFVESSHLFNCFLITRKCIKKVGLFDENFYPAYIEDNDYRIRVLLSGISYKRNQGNPKLFLHNESSTVNTNPFYRKKCDYTHELNKQYMHSKWGGEENTGWLTNYKTPFNIPNWPLHKWVLDLQMRSNKHWDALPDDETDVRLQILKDAIKYSIRSYEV